MRKKLFTFLFAALMSVGMFAAQQVITWSAQFCHDVEAYYSNGQIFTANNSKDGITVTYSGSDVNDLDGMRIGGIFLTGGTNSKMTFTSTVGDISKIEVYYYTNVLEDVPVGWTHEDSYDKFVWEGTPAASVDMMKGAERVGFYIKNIDFTIGEAEPEPQPAIAVENGTKGGFSYTLYDNGLLEISGSGAMPNHAFVEEDFSADVKNIRFAKDCEVYSLGDMWFRCYDSKYSQLETVEINSVVPISFLGEGIFYKQESAVTITITAPGIVNVESEIVGNYYSPVNMIFNVPATTVFEKNWFLRNPSYYAITIPTGATGHVPASLAFTDPDKQNQYDDAVEIGNEEWFWDMFGDGLIEGVDYNKVEESTFVITAENASQIFGPATVYFQDPAPQPQTIHDSDDAATIETFLSTNNGTEIAELKIDRPVLNNMYNTLCLPFDMDAAQIAASSLNGVEIYELNSVEVVNDELFLGLSDAVNAVVAGRPYIVKYSAASQLDDLDFENVTINNADLTAQAVTMNGVTFKGTFTPFVMGIQNGFDTNGGYLFLGQNDQLFWPNTNNPLKPFRAYFYIDLNSGSGNAPLRFGMPARIGRPAQMPTGVENVQSDKVQSTKVVENGQLIIIKNGVKYNAQGQMVK